jgi:hypothetical protein
MRRRVVFERERRVNERRAGDFLGVMRRRGAEGFALLRWQAALTVAIG